MAEYDSVITAFFGGDTTGLGRAIGTAEGMVEGFNRTLGKIGMGITSVAVLGFFKSVVDNVSNIQDFSDRVDASTDAIQAFQYRVSLAGGTLQDSQKIWNSVRKAVDDLAAGNLKAAEAFDKLGLSQKDLVGIPLEAALEKITKGYVASKGEAGAYSAMVEIAGGKSAKLDQILRDLGTEGMAAFINGMRAAGILIEKETIKQIDALGDRLTNLKGNLTGFGATVLKGWMFLGDTIGIAAAGVMNYADGIQSVMPKAAAIVVKAHTEITNAVEKQGEGFKTVAKIREEQLKTEKKIDEALAKFFDDRKELTQSYEKELEYAKLRSKATGALTSEERLQLEIHQQKNALLLREVELKAILKNGYGELSEEDKKRVAELLKQSKILETQIAQKVALIAAGKAQVVVEEEVVKVLEKQKPIEGGPLGARNIENQSTTSLEAKLSQIEKALATQRAADRRGLGVGGLSNVDYMAESQASAIRNELKFRTQFTGAIGRGGAEGGANLLASQGRDALSLDTILSQMSSWNNSATDSLRAQQETNTKIDRIGSLLNNTFGKG